MGKIEEQRDKKGLSHVNSWLVGMLVWPRLAPDQCSLSCLHIKFLPNAFLGEGILYSILYACVHMGLRVHQLESNCGLEGPCVCGGSDWNACRHLSERVSTSKD